MDTVYDFLILDLLFLIPALAVFILREDLRKGVLLVCLASIPFAFTEFLFYPKYWQPVFLFDLVNKIGFGIEDILFVTSLGAFSVFAYAFVFSKGYGNIEESSSVNRLKRAASVIASALTLTAVSAFIDIAVIYSAPVIMVGVSLVYMTVFRRDLIVSSIVGGVLVALIYFILCLFYQGLITSAFYKIWNTKDFLNVFIMGVPVEELIYGLGAGFAATAFYPFVFGKKFIPLENISGIKERFFVWIKASRLPSQTYIFLPLLLGQALSYAIGGLFYPRISLFIFIVGIFIQLFIVYANDVADYETDKKNETFNMFSGGSRVLVMSLLNKKSLVHASLFTAICAVIIAVSMSLSFEFRPFSFIFPIISIALLLGYSYPPFKISYRGGGEIMQAIGMALVLPIFGYYTQSGGLAGFPVTLFVSYFILQIASAIATALADESSDRIANKRTLAVLLGFFSAKVLSVFLAILAMLIFIVSSPLGGSILVSFAVAILPLASSVFAAFIINKAETKSRYLDYFVFAQVFATVSFTLVCSLAFIIMAR